MVAFRAVLIASDAHFTSSASSISRVEEPKAASETDRKLSTSRPAIGMTCCSIWPKNIKACSNTNIVVEVGDCFGGTCTWILYLYRRRLREGWRCTGNLWRLFGWRVGIVGWLFLRNSASPATASWPSPWSLGIHINSVVIGRVALGWGWLIVRHVERKCCLKQKRTECGENNK